MTTRLDCNTHLKASEAKVLVAEAKAVRDKDTNKWLDAELLALSVNIKKAAANAEESIIHYYSLLVNEVEHSPSFRMEELATRLERLGYYAKIDNPASRLTEQGNVYSYRLEIRWMK